MGDPRCNATPPPAQNLWIVWEYQTFYSCGDGYCTGEGTGNNPFTGTWSDCNDAATALAAFNHDQIYAYAGGWAACATEPFPWQYNR